MPRQIEWPDELMPEELPGYSAAKNHLCKLKSITLLTHKALLTPTGKPKLNGGALPSLELEGNAALGSRV